ncbi:MAG TPA: hypothetical protein VFG69_15370, partial [Nannocystaceae bacterium]|nr:hypothetical protein [Nannocystaceae bacterium]
MDHEPCHSPSPSRRTNAFAWWEAHGRRILFTLTLVAMAAPTSVWLQGRHEERMAAMAHREESRLVHSEITRSGRHERNMKFLDAALDPRSTRAQREAALRFLSTKLGPKSTMQQW